MLHDRLLAEDSSERAVLFNAAQTTSRSASSSTSSSNAKLHHVEPHYRVYASRFAMLGIFSFLSFTNAVLWSAMSSAHVVGAGNGAPVRHG